MTVPADSDDPDAAGDAAIRSEADRMEAILARLPPWLRRLVDFLMGRWPGRMVLRTATTSARIQLFDRSMAISAQIFTSVFPILIALASWFHPDSGSVTNVLNIPDDTKDLIDDALGSSTQTSFGIIGTLIVLVSATSLSRALIRAYAAIWQLSGTTSLRSWWRWLAVVVALAISLIAVRALNRAADDLPPPGFWNVIFGAAIDIVIGLYVPWVLLAGKLSRRFLLPGAVVYAVVMMFVRPVSAAWLPHALDVSASRYGAAGVAFTYLGWLYVLAFCLLLTGIVGYAAVVDDGKFGAWLRGKERWSQ